MKAMKCPVDGKAMLVAEHDEVEVDWCPGCEGVWLDAAELTLLFGAHDRMAQWLSAELPAAASAEKPRRCPICGTKMAKGAARGAAEIVCDRCPRGHGWWFDRGELAILLERGHPAPGGEEVTAWLRAVFHG